MPFNRGLIKITMNMCKYPLKNNTCRNVILLICAGIFSWLVLILLSSHEFHRHLEPTLTNHSSSTRHKNAFIQRYFNDTESLSRNYNYQFYDLTQENPLGIYFSDKHAGRLPYGNSHLEFLKTKRERQLKMALILVQNVTAPTVSAFGAFFAQQRIEYRFRVSSKELPSLVIEDIDLPRYSLIVFDDYSIYLNMDEKRRTILDNYCKKYTISVLALAHSSGNEDIEHFSDVKLTIRHKVRLKHFKLNEDSKIWRVAKVDEVYSEPLPSSDWSIFIPDHETYMPLVFSNFADKNVMADAKSSEFGCIIALHDQGLMDGIQRIILTYSIDFWLNAIVATDAITYLTDGLFGLTLTRILQVDIDDMFVGDSGIRTLVKDAKAMVASQEKLRKYIPEFTFKLGFSGEYYLKGNEDEQDGDRKIVEYAHNFIWFDHLSRHERLLNLNRTELSNSMSRNAKFANVHNLPTSRDYMVPPYHAGVYPIYEALYDEWNNRHMTCSSTMEYPKESPVWGRRGFIYRGVMVLPRMDCNLYTTVNRFEDFGGGKPGLDRSIKGDLLFKLFLHTPILIFMTHMSNYANDQLGQYSFENALQFVTKWTNLKLTTLPPYELAKQYFQMYPHETKPIWTNPCEYNSKHLEILPPDVLCSKFPKFFILGVRESGTKDDVEDTDDSQFFSGNTYIRGLHWYQNRFPEPDNGDTILFEASDTYFHDEESPRRISALVPAAKIILILDEPVEGAFCCIQDLQLQNNTNYTLREVVNADATSLKSLRDIKSKCLKSRAYAVNLARWLQFFSSNQIFFVDGDQLFEDSINILNKIQRHVKAFPFINFNNYLKYDSKKNRFCLLNGECMKSTKQTCKPLDDDSKQLLQIYFDDHNKNLKIILDDINQKYPKWLADNIPQ